MDQLLLKIKDTPACILSSHLLFAHQTEDEQLSQAIISYYNLVCVMSPKLK